MQGYQENKGLLVPVKGKGVYHGTLIRDGKVIDEFEDPNIAVAQGLTSMLGVYLHGDSQLSLWYLGLFEGNYTPVDGVTAATIASASTETTAYTNSTRPAYSPAAAASKSITNSASRASFVFNADKTIYGAFLISDNTKSGTSGTLFSAARFSNAKTVASGDELLLTYSFSLSV